MQKKSLLEEHIVYSDIIFAKIFTIKGTQKGVLTLSLYRLSFERRLLIRKSGTRVTAVNIQHLTSNI